MTSTAQAIGQAHARQAKQPRPFVDRSVTWTTADGSKIALGKLGDTHLCNIVRMLDRKVAKAEAAFDGAATCMLGARGDMAGYYSGHLFEDAATLLHHAQAQRDTFQAEVYRRHLGALLAKMRQSDLCAQCLQRRSHR